jgi:hypothetical protein
LATGYLSLEKKINRDRKIPGTSSRHNIPIGSQKAKPLSTSLLKQIQK